MRIPLGDGWRREERKKPITIDPSGIRLISRGLQSVVRQYDFYGNPYGLITIDGSREPGLDRARVISNVESRLNQIESRIRKADSAMKLSPDITVIVKVTNACDMQCRYCFIEPSIFHKRMRRSYPRFAWCTRSSIRASSSG